MSPRPRTAALLFVLPFALAPLSAQATQLDRDIKFVRTLATKLRFISLAQTEVDQMKQRYKDDETDFQSVAQLGIEISLIGAKVHPNREERRTLYQDALERCTQFLERYPDGPAALSARITLSDAALEFGRFLADEVELARIEAPSRVRDLEEQASDVFSTGEEACNSAMDELRDVMDEDTTQRGDFGVTWMRLGILLREHGRAVKKDREFLADRARETLEELIFEWGEETLLGQRALFEYAQIDEVVGALEDAVQGYRDVISNADTVLNDEELEISNEARELMVVILEEAYDRVGATLFELGRTNDVLQTVEEYRGHLESFGVPLTNLDDPANESGNEDTRFGHSLYLTAARAMAETGEPAQIDKAMKLVQHFNDVHPHDVVGLRAKVALREIMSAQQDVVSGAMLLEVAKGDYQASDWEAAVKGFKTAIAAMNADEQRTLGLEAYYLMARAFAVENRVLEATLALKLGLEKWGATAEDTTKENATSLIQRTMRQLQSNSKNDSYYDSLSQQVGDLAIKYGTIADASKRSYSDGGRLLSEKRYDEAVTSYNRVSADSPYYELAKSGAVRALFSKGDYDAARKAIAEYRAFLETRDAAIPEGRNDLRKAREVAQARTDFYEGYMLYFEGLGGDDRPADPTKFPEAIKLLGDYPDRHGKAEGELVPVVHYVLGRCHIAMGDLAKGEEKYRTLQTSWPRDPNVSILAAAIFGAYDDQVTAKVAEVEAVAKQDDGAQLDKARQELEALRRKAVSVGLEYFEKSEKPQYGISYLTLKHLEELKDFERVEDFGNKVLELFAESKHKDKVDRFVRAILGEAVLRQKKFRQAYDMLSAASAANPNNYPLKRLLCLSLGGWQEIDERGQIQRYLGLEQPAEAYDIYWNDYKAYGLNSTRGVEDYSIGWYEYYWELYHFALAASENDSEYAQRARTVYSKAQSFDDFATLDDLGPRGRELKDLFVDNPPPR